MVGSDNYDFGTPETYRKTSGRSPPGATPPQCDGVKTMEWPLQAYSVKLKRKVDIAEDSMELVTMKNGRHAVRGVAAEDRSINVFRILGNAEIEEVQAKLGPADK